ncbi:MAG: hypothetical protein KG012_04310 [Deltaproteobacteria bacterium]|nr:hypothetical protein [Deltaproteobacteria bacterium]
MAEIFAVDGYDGSGWNISIGESNKIAACGAAFGSSISVGGFQSSMHKTNSDMTVDGCETDHMRNTKYVDETHVDLGAGSVELITDNVGVNDCPTRWKYQDDENNTVIENAIFFFYNGSDPAVAPVGVLAVAFERTSAAIRKNRIGGDSAGKAWDADYGVGGNAAALSLADQVSGSIHYFYIGISLSPTSKGLKTAVRARVEFDVS